MAPNATEALLNLNKENQPPLTEASIIGKKTAVAIDLDGTLLDDDKVVSPENIAALRELHKNGVRIVLASGRMSERVQIFEVW